MNASQYVMVDNPKIAADRFIQSNQLNEYVSRLAELNLRADTSTGLLLFSRVRSTPDQRHEEVMNFLKNRLPEKIKPDSSNSIPGMKE